MQQSFAGDEKATGKSKAKASRMHADFIEFPRRDIKTSD
jgi:hypothetical protein